MSHVSKDAKTIVVHGREGLNIPYTRYLKSPAGREQQVDISGMTIFFEVPGAHLRLQLIPNPSDAMGLLIQLSRAQVATLPTIESDFIVIDESAIVPVIEWEGKISRVGYVGAP
jgi:hypothetical protein